MRTHRESVYGCGAAELPKPDWGRYTQNGNVLFAHWMYPWIGPINIAGAADRAGMVTLLMDGSELPTSTRWWGNEGAGNFFVNVKAPVYRTYPPSNDLDTVIRIEPTK